jgi:hypothetical protein
VKVSGRVFTPNGRKRGAMCSGADGTFDWGHNLLPQVPVGDALTAAAVERGCGVRHCGLERDRYRRRDDVGSVMLPALTLAGGADKLRPRRSQGYGHRGERRRADDWRKPSPQNSWQHKRLPHRKE